MNFDQVKHELAFLDFVKDQMRNMVVDECVWKGKVIFVLKESKWLRATVASTLSNQAIAVLYAESGKGDALSLKGETIFFFEHETPLPPRTNLDGLWRLPTEEKGEQRLVNICGNRIIWKSNSSFDSTFLAQMESVLGYNERKRLLTFQLGDKTYKGKILNQNSILWNQNEKWCRVLRESNKLELDFLSNRDHYWGVMVNPKTFEIIHIMPKSQFDKLKIKKYWRIIEVNDTPVLESNKEVIYDFLCQGLPCRIKFEKRGPQTYERRTQMPALINFNASSSAIHQEQMMQKMVSVVKEHIDKQKQPSISISPDVFVTAMASSDNMPAMKEGKISLNARINNVIMPSTVPISPSAPMQYTPLPPLTKNLLRNTREESQTIEQKKNFLKEKLGIEKKNEEKKEEGETEKEEIKTNGVELKLTETIKSEKKEDETKSEEEEQKSSSEKENEMQEDSNSKIEKIDVKVEEETTLTVKEEKEEKFDTKENRKSYSPILPDLSVNSFPFPMTPKVHGDHQICLGNENIKKEKVPWSTLQSKDMKSWTRTEVCSFFEHIELPMYSKIVEEKYIDGDVLFYLDRKQAKALEIQIFHLPKLLRKIDEIKAFQILQKN